MPAAPGSDRMRSCRNCDPIGRVSHAFDDADPAVAVVADTALDADEGLAQLGGRRTRLAAADLEFCRR